ncbi:MAG: MFS transporter [Streptosporangiaceae bacterium]
MRRALGISNTDIGLLVSVTSVVGAVFSLPFGVLADRARRTWVLALALVTWGAAMLWSATASSFGELLLARLCRRHRDGPAVHPGPDHPQRAHRAAVRGLRRRRAGRAEAAHRRGPAGHHAAVAVGPRRRRAHLLAHRGPSARPGAVRRRFRLRVRRWDRRAEVDLRGHAGSAGRFRRLLVPGTAAVSR